MRANDSTVLLLLRFASGTRHQEPRAGRRREVREVAADGRTRRKVVFGDEDENGESGEGGSDEEDSAAMAKVSAGQADGSGDGDSDDNSDYDDDEPTMAERVITSAHGGGGENSEDDFEEDGGGDGEISESDGTDGDNASDDGGDIVISSQRIGRRAPEPGTDANVSGNDAANADFPFEDEDEDSGAAGGSEAGRSLGHEVVLAGGSMLDDNRTATATASGSVPAPKGALSEGTAALTAGLPRFARPGSVGAVCE